VLDVSTGGLHLADNVRHRLRDQFIDLLGVDDVDFFEAALFERVNVDLPGLILDQACVIDRVLRSLWSPAT